MIIQESFSYSLLKRTSISNSNSISSEDEIDVNWGNTILNEDVILAVAIANKPELFYSCEDHFFIYDLYFRSSHYLHVSFLSRVKMNSTNLPAPDAWVFIAQMVEHWSACAKFPTSFLGLFA